MEALQVLIRVWAKTDGRDKTCKTIQYACRFVRSYWPDSGMVDKVKKVEASFTQSRKVFRLGKSVRYVPKLQDVLALASKGQFDSDLLLKLVSACGMFGYFVCDNMVWASMIKILDSPTKAVLTKRAKTFWFYGLLASAVIQIRALAKLVDELEAAKTTTVEGEDAQEVRTRRRALRKKIVLQMRAKMFILLRNACDLQNAGAAVIGRFNPSDAWIGAAGVVSGLTSLLEVYLSVATK